MLYDVTTLTKTSISEVTKTVVKSRLAWGDPGLVITDAQLDGTVVQKGEQELVVLCPCHPRLLQAPPLGEVNNWLATPLEEFEKHWYDFTKYGPTELFKMTSQVTTLTPVM